MKENCHIFQHYREQEQKIFSAIPGMQELLHTDQAAAQDLQTRYPDAAFALMTASDILTGDRERNAIHQDAYFSILHGENIADVRARYTKAMDRYLQLHMWDD